MIVWIDDLFHLNNEITPYLSTMYQKVKKKKNTAASKIWMCYYHSHPSTL
jgi:hypothetical protein